MLFNLGDILYNEQEAKKTLINRDYAAFGANVARMISDVFYINPTDEDVWSDVNSLIIESDSSSKKVPSSFYGQLVVEAPSPNSALSLLSKPVHTLQKVGHIIDAVAAHQKPRIRDDKSRSQRKERRQVMELKTFGEDDVRQHGISAAMEELSPKYQSKKKILAAHKQSN